MKRLLFMIFCLIVSLTVGYRILSTWRGISLYQTDLSKENLLKAIQINPSNPDPFYRLGLFYQWNIQNIDLKESVHYLSGAIERNPLEQEYWINLARIFQRLGKRDASEQSLEMDTQVFPVA